MDRLGDLVLGNLERFFYWYNLLNLWILYYLISIVDKYINYFPLRWGLKVARHPLAVITSCVLITGVASIGYLNFR